MIVDPHSDHRLLFIEVDDFRNDVGRLHLDRVPTDLCRDDEIDRVVAPGATQIADRRNRDGTGWMVLADPTGNRFCILRSDEVRIERAASVARDDSEVSCAQVLRN